MQEARVLSRQWSEGQNIKNFLAANSISIAGGFLFLLLAIFTMWPVIEVLIKSLVGREGLTLGYYKDFVTKSYYYRSFLNTLFLGILTTSVCITIGFCIAYLTTRGPVSLRRPLKLIVLLPLIAPPYIFALSLIILMGNNGIITKALNLNLSIYGFPGCVIGQTLALLPLAYMLIENALVSINPNLDASAANLGASEVEVLRSITIPLLAPAIFKAALVVYVMSVAEFGNVVILSGRTPFLAPDIYVMITGEADFNMASVLSIFLLLPCVSIFFLQHYLIKGKAYTTILGKPTAAELKQITPAILIPFCIFSFIACGLILITFGVVGIGAFTKILGVDNTFLLSHILDSKCNTSLINSIKISLLAGMFGAVLGITLAYVIVRGKFKGRSALEAISLTGFAFPGAVMGVGYILAFNKPPLLLVGTATILVVNCVFRAFAVGEEAGIIKLHQLSIEIEEASFNLGASTITTFRRIVVPNIFPAFIYGFVYVFMRSMVTLSAVVFLVSPGHPLVSIYIFDTAAWGYIGLACAATLKLILVVGTCLALLQALSKWTGISVTGRRSLHE